MNARHDLHAYFNHETGWMPVPNQTAIDPEFLIEKLREITEQRPAKAAFDALEKAFIKVAPNKILTPWRRDSGTTYIDHALITACGAVQLAMMDGCSDDDLLQQWMTSLLHDVKEDNPGVSDTVDQLVKHGLRRRRLKTLNTLNKPNGARYFDEYYDAILRDPFARRTKLPDSLHNSSPTEQVRNIAFGQFKNGLRRYNICIPLLWAIQEKRYDDLDGGVLGYLASLGQDLLIPQNLNLFKVGFTDQNFKRIVNTIGYLESQKDLEHGQFALDFANAADLDMHNHLVLKPMETDITWSPSAAQNPPRVLHQFTHIYPVDSTWAQLMDHGVPHTLSNMNVPMLTHDQDAPAFHHAA